ncbi:MAG: TylF/MycF/NovP-related O-methyltransferase [Bryobacteraceae bacterium]
MVRQWVRKSLGWAGYVVFNTRSRECYARDSLFTSNNDSFREDPIFKAAYARGVKASGGVDPQIEWRVHVALWVARAAIRVPGDFVECGVNAGFISSAIMHGLGWRNVEKRFYLIDTFNGPVLAQYSKEEVNRGRRRIAEKAMAQGAYVTSLERARANYSEWPNVEVVQGVAPEVLPALGIENVAFLHIDMNCAYPERAALEYFWDLLSPHAMVLLDDYAYFGNNSLARAIDSAAASLGTQVLSLPTGQGLIVK